EIELRTIDLDGDLVAARPALHRGAYVRLSVRDNGSGMNPEVIDRIFEPFFTTKDASEGTGLGLSVVHGIVQSHGGDILVESEPDVGTTFTIFLPQVGQAVSPEAKGKREDPAGSESVMFVDDSQNIVDLAREMLEYLGYRITAFTDSEVALESLRANPDAFDVLVTDQTMPSLSGLELAAHAKQVNPRLPIVILSGITETLSTQRLAEAGVSECIHKPIRIHELGAAIRRVVDKRFKE
ncbi:MAG: ATP-binding protein, partial [Gemmatimonadales bacterium]